MVHKQCFNLNNSRSNLYQKGVQENDWPLPCVHTDREVLPIRETFREKWTDFPSDTIRFCTHFSRKAFYRIINLGKCERTVKGLSFLIHHRNKALVSFCYSQLKWGNKRLLYCSTDRLLWLMWEWWIRFQ